MVCCICVSRRQQTRVSLPAQVKRRNRARETLRAERPGNGNVQVKSHRRVGPRPGVTRPNRQTTACLDLLRGAAGRDFLAKKCRSMYSVAGAAMNTEEYVPVMNPMHNANAKS